MQSVNTQLLKLMAIKDEYEVARLYTDGHFLQQVRDSFEGDFRFHFHLTMPLMARLDSATGRIEKREFGPWMLTAMRCLARMRRWRGTIWDVFRHNKERLWERSLLADYEDDLAHLLPRITADTRADVLALLGLPERIRGFGHIKKANAERLLGESERLRARLGLATRR